MLTVGAAGTEGPAITVTDCYEGLEGAEVSILSGNIGITSQDDCINAANSDLSGYAFSLTISGGTVNAYSAGGDGFDSNGEFTISGGTVAVWTASTADDQPLDADGTLTLSGGTVLAAADSDIETAAAQTGTAAGMNGIGGGRSGPPAGGGTPPAAPGGRESAAPAKTPEEQG